MASSGSRLDEVQARVDRLRAAANEAAKFAVARYTTFLLVTVYLGIMVGTTTDEHLLRESGLKLPLFGVALPVVPFYMFIPLFYVLLHVNVISQYAILAPMLHKLRAALSELRPPAQQDEQRGLIYPSSFSHMHLKTATTLRMRFLLRMSAVVPLIVLPLLLLCWIQRQFLPYHSMEITWLHRLYVLVDLLVLWVYWPRRKDDPGQAGSEASVGDTHGAKHEREGWARRVFMRVARICSLIWATTRTIGGGVMYHGVRLGSTALILAFTLVIATVPGKTADSPWFAMDVFWPNKDAYMEALTGQWPKTEMATRFILAEQHRAKLRNWVLGRFDPRERSWGPSFLERMEVRLHRNLVLREMILVEEPPPPELLAAYKVKDQDLEQAWIEHAKGIDLRGRDLRHADFSKSTLYDADFRGANLTRADLSEAKLPNAKFEVYVRDDGTRTPTLLTGAYLESANLRGANLSEAVLHRANLRWAKLHGANLRLAELHDARLEEAELHDAILERAKLHDANLTLAELHGADLRWAILHGAILVTAKLHGADLLMVKLHSARLDDAELQGSDLTGARTCPGPSFTART